MKLPPSKQLKCDKGKENLSRGKNIQFLYLQTQLVFTIKIASYWQI